jgi:hypothetical protein
VVTRLTFELVPETCWWSNVRSQVTKAQWEKCKAYVKKRSGSRCEICNGVGRKWPVECHEIWAYDDEAQVQTLVGLVALCPTCHQAKHIGRTMEVLSIGEVDRVLDHVQQVNNWSRVTVHKAVQNTFAIWQIRSQWQWDLDVSYLATIGIELPKYVWKREERDASRADH